VICAIVVLLTVNYSVFSFYLKQCITLTGEAVVCETTAFADQGDSNQTQSALAAIVGFTRSPRQICQQSTN